MVRIALVYSLLLFQLNRTCQPHPLRNSTVTYRTSDRGCNHSPRGTQRQTISDLWNTKTTSAGNKASNPTVMGNKWPIYIWRSVLEKKRRETDGEIIKLAEQDAVWINEWEGEWDPLSQCLSHHVEAWDREAFLPIVSSSTLPRSYNPPPPPPLPTISGICDEWDVAY